MQLHASVLLLIIATDQILASSHQRCGGNVSLDQEPAGFIQLSLPGLSNDTDGLGPLNTTLTLLHCTWVFELLQGRTVVLTLMQLESDWSVFLQCFWKEERRELQSGVSTLLHGCDQNKATLSWTGPESPSNSIKLAHYVQEDERNSSEVWSTPHEDRSSSGWTETEAVHKSIATVAQKVVKSTERGRGHLYEGPVWSFGPQHLSGSPAQDTTSPPQQGLSVSGNTDGETLPLPEEGANNGKDTSGAAQLTDDPTTATTHPYVLNTVSSVTKSQTEDPTEAKISYTSLDIHLRQSTHLSTQTDQGVSSSSSVLYLSPSEMATQDAAYQPPEGAISQAPEGKQAISWTIQQSTDGHFSELPSTNTTFDPLNPSSGSLWRDSSGADTQPTLSSSSLLSSKTRSAIVTETSAGSMEPASLHPFTRRSDVTALSTSAYDGNTDVFQAQNTESRKPFSHTSSESTQTREPKLHSFSESPNKWTSGSSGSLSAVTQMGKVQTAATSTVMEKNTEQLPATVASPTGSAAVYPLSATTKDSTTPAFLLQTESPDSISTTLPVSDTESFTLTGRVYYQSEHSSSQTSAMISTDTQATIKSDDGEVKIKDQHWLLSAATTIRPDSTERPSQTFTATSFPRFYIVPNQPATIRVEFVELLLQIVVEKSLSASSAGLGEDATAWLEPYLQKAPGFSKLLGVWSSGPAVQCLVLFKTREALQWLSSGGLTSLLDKTGLDRAVHEGRLFRSSKVTNITLGGLQADVCDWLLQCPAGYKCVPKPGTTNYSCSSVCRFDYCHHHGICTHHHDQLPVCRCVVGDDFWFIGRRCDMRMTRARLVGACLAVLLFIAMLITVLALVVVRRYRALLVQAKADTTRSSYRKFNHFDELSARFWLRSWAGSADSLDNPAFTRSDELLHLRALDRPCCYHDDTLSLASTCPSHGAQLSTIYPHSAQYGWRGSGVSVGDGVLDSGKASDLSVCSWPVEPIHWTPFPLLHQLSSHRTPTVRVTRPRSYCEGMELVDMGKSWTA